MATLDMRLILVREDQVAWIKLVDFYGSSIMVISAKFYFGIALLFTKLAIRTRMKVYSGRPKFDTKVTNDSGPAKPLTVMEHQMYPASVPGENILFM